jgi:glycosyltransferase involved in cell wall biosynthesis
MTTKYRVALIHNIISPYRVPLFEALAKHPSIDLMVYYCSGTHKNRKWPIISSNEYKYDILPGKTIELCGYTYHINPCIVRILAEERYDIVIIGGCTDFTTQVAFLLSKLRNIPIILWSEGIKDSPTLLGKCMNLFTRYVARNANAILVPGVKSKGFHIRLGAFSEKIFIAHNIVNNQKCISTCREIKIKKENIKEQLNISEKKTILFVGRLVKKKGVQHLIDAYQEIKQDFENCCLIIVGDGDFRSELVAKCTKDKIKDVIFTGWCDENETLIYYSISDIFVLPSLSDLCPLVINEAMACGLPVITTDVVGCGVDMIHPNVNGYITEAKSITQLTSAIRRLITNDGLMKMMGKESFYIVNDEFCIENTVKNFVSAIEYALSKSQ